MGGIDSYCCLGRRNHLRNYIDSKSQLVNEIENNEYERMWKKNVEMNENYPDGSKW